MSLKNPTDSIADRHKKMCRQLGVKRWRNRASLLLDVEMLRSRKDAQARFQKYRHWPAEVAAALKELPPGFVTNYSMHVESAAWIFRYVLDNKPGAILELGCGISTVIIGLALKRVPAPAVLLSLESEEEWLLRTQEALHSLKLAAGVDLRHTPLKSYTSAGRSFKIHDFSEMKGRRPDLFLVDAPPGELGRGGALPYFYDNLADGARVILDDAERPNELAAVQFWTETGMARLEEFMPIGRGFAALTVTK